MSENIDTLIEEVRKAIDDIQPSVDDSFSSDVDAELQQCLFHAAEMLTVEVPVSLLAPSKYPASGPATETEYIKLSSVTDYLRFVELSVTDWTGKLYALMDPDSDEAKMQRSPWSQGSATKPKATVEYYDGGLSIHYWPSGTLTCLAYAKKPSKTSQTTGSDQDAVTTYYLNCDLRDECRKNLIYRTASLFLEGKKEHEAAAKFQALSTL